MKEMLLALLLLIIGFVLLIKGADFFVDGSSSVAKRLKVPSMIIGLTIVISYIIIDVLTKTNSSYIKKTRRQY